MRFHVVGMPHAQTTSKFSSCAYTTKVRNFCKMMMGRSHEVFLYSGEHNDTLCTVHTPCLTEKERAAAVGAKHYTQASFDITLPHWKKFNANVAVAVDNHAREKDFLCLIAGTAQKPICDALHVAWRPLGPNAVMPAVEFGVGYGGSFANFKVFESYAWMHMNYGRWSDNVHNADGRWYDTVIPGFVDVVDFPTAKTTRTKYNYMLYAGRMEQRKGIHVALQVAKAAGVQLVTAGPGDPMTGVKHLGQIGVAKRARVMREALCLIAPTLYIEPFGLVVVEAMACGTPVVTTDWGAFTETVIHGETGFRCHTLQEFVSAVKGCSQLNRGDIRDYALTRFGFDTVGEQYETYFGRIHDLWNKGWETVV